MAALFGSRVRRLRTAAGLIQAELGDRTHVVSTRITQIERASGAKPTLELTRALDAALGADDLLVELWPYVYREAFPDWSRKFMDYSARAVLSVGRTLGSEEQLEERVAFRVGRQERLGTPDRPELWVVLDEAVLRRPVGGQAVMREQFARLLRTTVEPHITVQVLPFDQGEHDVMGGSLTVLTMPDGSEIAYTEGAHYGQLIEDPDEVRRFALTYDRLRAAALPPFMSLDMIRSVMEDNHRGAKVPSRSERRRVAQEQLQQSGRRQLRGGGRPVPRDRRPRP
ncbi:helix-turn-helix transcriptional regulator [Streptomyces sp. ActVer]|uniref:helix-turn-helix domain-containing protein n=1 Tax=Streptomyces sp. ActVer TaxID=3014558 RepID=UPI0022B580AC|nr:helix-turn-helix transcriptional regulator [Streptomyces sp. ActVer]MCZ4509211.1 helix-turn-helix transcriptional regulator [Streptomyces sp. ActVer]